MSGGAQILDVFALAAQLARGETTEEDIELAYGEEGLHLVQRIQSDPFDEVLGG